MLGDGGDLSGLDEWRQVFGDQFEPAFAFAYWRVGETTCDGDGVVLAGRAYAFRVVRLDDYAAHQRRRSPRWGTLTLSTADFRRLAKPPDVLWPTE
ncbi:MAG: HYExAFE family protein [Phycisphaerae bacterium]